MSFWNVGQVFRYPVDLNGSPVFATVEAIHTSSEYTFYEVEIRVQDTGITIKDIVEEIDMSSYVIAGYYIPIASTMPVNHNKIEECTCTGFTLLHYGCKCATRG